MTTSRGMPLQPPQLALLCLGLRGAHRRVGLSICLGGCVWGERQKWVGGWWPESGCGHELGLCASGSPWLDAV